MHLVYKGHTPLSCTRALPPAFTLILYVLRFCITVSVHVFWPGLLVLNIVVLLRNVCGQSVVYVAAHTLTTGL